MGQRTKGTGKPAKTSMPDLETDWEFDDDGSLWHAHGLLWSEVRKIVIRGDRISYWQREYVGYNLVCVCGKSPPKNAEMYYRLLHKGEK